MVPTRHYSGRNKKRSEGYKSLLWSRNCCKNTVLQFIDETNNKIDACIDQTRPSLVIDIDVLKQPFLMKKKTVTISNYHL